MCSSLVVILDWDNLATPLGAAAKPPRACFCLERSRASRRDPIKRRRALILSNWPLQDMATLRGSLRLPSRVAPRGLPRCCNRGFSSPAQSLKRRAVVGSFLLRRDEHDGVPKVALFRRTDQVVTYQHKYATISGGIEAEDADPLAAAKRELREETTLDADVAGLRLLARGVPYSFVDGRAGYEWSVYPFAFGLPPRAEQAMRLGDDHAGHAWFATDALPIPELAAGVVESLRRVWPEGPLARVDALARLVLREDTGVDAAAEAMRQVVTAGRRLAEGRDEWWRLVRLAGWHVWRGGGEGEGVLGRVVVPSLVRLEGLVRAQGDVLGPGFEGAAAEALADLNLNLPGGEEDENVAELTERLFAGLWEVPDEVL